MVTEDARDDGEKARWQERLQEFSFQIQHRRGLSMAMPTHCRDGMSPTGVLSASRRCRGGRNHDAQRVRGGRIARREGERGSDGGDQRCRTEGTGNIVCRERTTERDGGTMIAAGRREGIWPEWLAEQL